MTFRPISPSHRPHGLEDRDVVVLTPALGNAAFVFLMMLAAIVGFTFVGFTESGFLAGLAIATVPFWGLAALSAGSHFIPGANYLSIDRDGFTLSRMWRVKRYRWADIKEPLRLLHQKFQGNTTNTLILFVVSNNQGPEAFVNRLIGIRGRSLSHLYKGMSAEALVDLMNERRDQAIGRERQEVEEAGVEFTNGGEPGVKLRKQS